MDDVVRSTFIGIIVVALFGTGITIGYNLAEAKFKRIAIDAGTAAWCVEDHRKVFKWGNCQEKNGDN